VHAQAHARSELGPAMVIETWSTLGLVGGVAGIALGAVILVFRERLHKAILPRLTRVQACRLSWGVAVSIWSVAIVALSLSGDGGGGRPNVQSGDVTGVDLAGGDLEGRATAIGLTPEQVRDLMGQERPETAMVVELGKRLGVTESALSAFLRILDETEVELVQLPAKLAEIARRHRRLLQRSTALDLDDPGAARLVKRAREAIAAGEYDSADKLLKRAEEIASASIQELEARVRQIRKGPEAKQLVVAALRAERGELAMTRLRYLEAARHFERAAQRVPEGAEEERVEYLSRQADALERQGEEQGDNATLLRAIAVYRTVLPLTPRDATPLRWAMIQSKLGNALRRLGERESGADRLETAVTAYRAALEEQGRERVPLDWAATQNNLGDALRILGEREKASWRLEGAVTAYRAALKERTRERVPLDWAATQNNLGLALWRLGEWESGTWRLEEAVMAYRAALEERTRERVPLDWAATQNNLGTALWRLGERESGLARLEEAIAAYCAALKERTRERVPLDWAATQNNLGDVLLRLREGEDGTARLEEAVLAYRAALKERTSERMPLDWAVIQNNLGIALESLGRRQGDKGRLEEAVSAYRAALVAFATADEGHYVQVVRGNLERAEALLARHAD
jgi:tetratricopeptide (TPR) repeat protein